MRQSDAVMHFAAYAYVGESVENPRKYFQNNVEAALTLLNTAMDAGVRRFVCSSTCAVYATPDKVLMIQDLVRRSINPHATSNLFFENALASYVLAYALRFSTLR